MQDKVSSVNTITNLYQERPYRMSTYRLHKSYSTTDSLESYNNAARREVCILLRNRRKAKHEIVIHHLTELPLKQVHETWRKIKGYLKKSGIVAWTVTEITRDNRSKPTNRIHRHLLIDGKWSDKTLRRLFKDSCLCSGLEKKDFRIDYRTIPNFKKKVFYATKCNRPNEVILFTKHTGIRKFEAIGPWFLDESGNPISRTESWENVKKQLKELSEQRDESIQTNKIMEDR